MKNGMRLTEIFGGRGLTLITSVKMKGHYMKTKEFGCLMKNVAVLGRGLLSCVLIFCSLGLSVQAANWTWNGAADPDVNWNTAGNWVEASAPASASDTMLFFDGSTGLACQNNIANPLTLNSLIFNSGAGAFSLGPNFWTGNGKLEIHGGIVNNSATLQTVNNQVIFGAPITINAASGPVKFDSNSWIQNGGYDLIVSGISTTMISGFISGDGGLIKNGSGTLLIGSQWYPSSVQRGRTTINEGLVSVTSGSIFYGGSGVTVTNGAVFDTTVSSGGGFSESTNLVTGSNSLWRGDGQSHGFFGSNTKLEITSGGTLSNAQVTYNGSGSQLIVSDGGLVSSAWTVELATTAGSSNNTVLVTGAASRLNAMGYFFAGHSGCSNSVIVSDGATLTLLQDAYGLIMGWTSTASNNVVLVTGAGTVCTNKALVLIGHQGPKNHLTISDGATIFANTMNIGLYSGDNLVSILNGGNAKLGYLYVGDQASSNSLIVSGGSTVQTRDGYWGLSLGINATSSNNTVLITGTGTICSNSGNVWVGQSGSKNGLTISNEATHFVSSVIVGYSASASENLYRIMNGGGLKANGQFILGENGCSNSLIVSGGSMMEIRDGYYGLRLGINSVSSNNTALITGVGTVCTNRGNVWVGQSGSMNTLTISDGAAFWANDLNVGDQASASDNLVSVLNGGVLNASNLKCLNGTGHVINNSGGVYQFSTLNPTVQPNGAGNIALNNGVISFRDLTGVNVKNNQGGSQLDQISYTGANAFRLNNASNSTSVTQTYVFNTGLGATNYAGLEMVGGNTSYTNGSVTVGANGWLMFSNTTAVVWGPVTNNGTLRIVDSTVTFMSDLVLGEGCSMLFSSNNVGNNVTVNGLLKLPVSANLTLLPTPGKKDAYPLFTSMSTNISGSASSWTVNPGTSRASKSSDGTQLLLRPRVVGFVFIVE